MIDVLLDLLRSDGSIIVNKKLARSLGLNQAVMYSELISKYMYFKNKDQLTDDGYFFNTRENMEHDTTLNDYHQRKAINDLVKLKLISKTTRGIPAKRYFRIENNDYTLNLLKKVFSDQQNQQFSKEFKTCNKVSEKLELYSVQSNNTKVNNTKKDTNIYINLPIDDYPFLNLYNRYFYRKYGKDHMKVTEEQLDFILNGMEELKTWDVDINKFNEAVAEHFSKLPESNNGNIIAFLHASFRYFEVDLVNY